MAGRSMRALQYGSYGGGVTGLKHVEVPVPSPGKDELLIKVEATSLNPIDWKIQNGMFRPLFPRKFPFTPASDVAGEIVEVGSGVKNFKPGDKVLAILHHSGGGGLAEYAVAKEIYTVLKPSEISSIEVAGLPGAGITAHMALTQAAGIRLDGSGPHKNVLITAASGGVGHYALQLAKLGNTHVTVSCGARNIELLKSLGADEIVDYKTEEGAALKSPSGKKYDVVLHCASGIAWSVFEPNLSERGKVINLTPSVSAFATILRQKLIFSKKRLELFFMSPKSENLECLVEWMREGKIKTVVDSKHPLSRGEEAWRKCMDGHATGKIIVEM